MNDAEKYEFEETVKELESYRGRHTELISILIPAEFNINNVVKQIDTEKGTAENIKSKNVRKAVLDALERISRQLKVIGQKLPANGLAMYAGNVSEVEGQEDIRLWTIEPPKELRVRVYRCDQTFVVDPLREMLETEEVYGLLVIDRKEATVGILDGKTIKVLHTMTSGIPSKQRSGGQSAMRFQRATEEYAKEFYRRVSDVMKDCFFENKKLKGILVGGPIPTKEEYLEVGNLATQLKDKIIGIRDIGDSEFAGLRALVEASKDILSEQEVTKQKEILDEFFMMLAKQPEKVAYGTAEVEERLNQGAVGKLVLSKELPRNTIKHFEELAKATAVEVHIVTSETQEGVQFFSIGGVGGILRFAMS